MIYRSENTLLSVGHAQWWCPNPAGMFFQGPESRVTRYDVSKLGAFTAFS